MSQTQMRIIATRRLFLPARSGWIQQGTCAPRPGFPPSTSLGALVPPETCGWQRRWVKSHVVPWRLVAGVLAVQRNAAGLAVLGRRAGKAWWNHGGTMVGPWWDQGKITGKAATSCWSCIYILQTLTRCRCARF